MNEEQLKKVQDEILEGMDAEIDEEASLISAAKEIGAKLSLGGPGREELEGKVYVFNYRPY